MSRMHVLWLRCSLNFVYYQVLQWLLCCPYANNRTIVPTAVYPQTFVLAQHAVHGGEPVGGDKRLMPRDEQRCCADV